MASFGKLRISKKDSIGKPNANENAPHSSSSNEKTAACFEKDCIRAHNDYRAKHNVPMLKQCPELSKKAQSWANKLAKDDKMSHDHEHQYGENVYSKWSSDPNHQVGGEEAVNSWYAEIKNYHFDSEPEITAQNIGHFTQVVWKGSERVGVGMARSSTGRVFVVANYQPAGNYLGRYKENVLTPVSK